MPTLQLLWDAIGVQAELVNEEKAKSEKLIANSKKLNADS